MHILNALAMANWPTVNFQSNQPITVSQDAEIKRRFLSLILLRFVETDHLS